MATASELVKQAYRELNLVAANRELTSDQESEGLTLLNRYIDSLLGFELGELLFDWTTPPSTTSPTPARFPQFPTPRDLASDVWPYPPPNVRLLLRLLSDTTIYLQQDPDDGARMLLVDLGNDTTNNLTVNANGRLVKGADTITDTPSNLNQQLLFYRADLGNWQVIADLALTDNSPLPSKFDDLLALGVAKRLAPRFGKSLTAEAVTDHRRLLRLMKSQYRQEVQMPSKNPQPFLRPSAEMGNIFSIDRSLT